MSIKITVEKEATPWGLETPEQQSVRVHGGVSVAAIETRANSHLSDGIPQSPPQKGSACR